MKRTAKLVHSTLRWKHKNCSIRSNDVHVTIDDNDDDGASQTLLDSETKQTIIFPPNNVCFIKQSPYRILKAADAGNLDNFITLYRENNARLQFADKEGRSALHIASSKNHYKIVEFIIEHADLDVLNMVDRNGNTALHFAVMNNAIGCLSILIESGADSGVLNNDMNAPVHMAVSLNRTCILKELVKHKDRVNIMIRGKHGRSALHLAAIYDFDQCARILLSQFNCCPKTPCNNGSYAIHEAAKNASAKTLEAILEWGEKRLGIERKKMMEFFDAEGNVPLHSAVHSGDIRAVELCLKSGAVLSTQQHDLSTPVHLACSQGAIEIVKLMFTSLPEQKLDCLRMCDSQIFTPLHCAALFNHKELVKYLVKEGASLNVLDKEGRSPLLLASSRGAWASVTALIELGSNVSLRDLSNRNIFHWIVLSGGHLDKFTEIIAKKSKEPVNSLLNDKDNFGCTPLHYASRDGQFKTIQSLLQMGAVINLKNNDNQSPLHFAARYGRQNTVKHLLESQKGHLIINEMDEEGMTALHIASANGHTKIVQYLLIRGALLHRDHKGRTPVHWAAINGYVETLQQILLVHSHLLDQVDKDGNSALTLAAINNRANVAQVLLTLQCRWTGNNEAMTPIDYAIVNRNCEVAKVMVMHPKRGEEIMKSHIKTYGSLVEGLIANMPEVLKCLLDREIERSESEDSQNYCIKYNFRYLRELDSTSATGQPLPICNLMIAYGREDLLSQALCMKYLETKWNSYGMYFHILNMSFYLMFLTLITSNGLKVIDVTHAANRTDHSMTIVDLIKSNDATRYHSRIVKCLSAAIVVFVLLNIIKEFYQIYHQRLRYFTEFINIFEWTLYVSSGVMSVSFLFAMDIHCSYLYICTAISVFVAWFNLLFYLQRFNRGGIYVVMFLEILSTLIKVIFVFSVLIIAFGLSFYILFAKFNLFHSAKGFSRPVLSMIRVSTMMLGETDFVETFLRPILTFNSSISIEKTQIVISLIFLVIFIILMPILLMNLLIGLAVGDIETVRNDAHLKRLTMQVDLHTDLERKLPKAFISMTDKKQLSVYPNKTRCSIIERVIQKYFKKHPHKAFAQLKNKQNAILQNTTSFTMFKASITGQLNQQRRKILNLSRQGENQLELLRLIVQKMEIQTENDFDSDEDMADDDFQ